MHGILNYTHRGRRIEELHGACGQERSHEEEEGPGGLQSVPIGKSLRDPQINPLAHLEISQGQRAEGTCNAFPLPQPAQATKAGSDNTWELAEIRKHQLLYKSSSPPCSM